MTLSSCGFVRSGDQIKLLYQAIILRQLWHDGDMHWGALKGTLTQILKSPYNGCVRIKILPWKFCIFNSKGYRAIHP